MSIAKSVAELPKPKYPIEDSELPHYLSKTGRQLEKETCAVPQPVKQLSLSNDLIYVWDFCFVFAEPLGVYPFSLDEFEQSLAYDKFPCPIIDQLHSRLLSVASEFVAYSVSKAKPQKSKSQLKRTKSVDVLDEEDQNTEDEIVTGVKEQQQQQYSGVIDPYYPDRWWQWESSADGWAQTLTACLFHLATVASVPLLKSICTKLLSSDSFSVQLDDRTGKAVAYNSADSKEEESLEIDYRDNFTKLTVEEKLQILNFLITETVLPSQKISKFIDSCSQLTAELRKEKRELDVKMRDR